MTDELHFRIPLISPYLTRANEHIRWNLKRALNADKALRERVQGKVVLITGASSGIGARVAGEPTDAGWLRAHTGNVAAKSSGMDAGHHHHAK